MPWSCDIWSLGTIILEIITGMPLWMSFKCRVQGKNGSIFNTGLFGIPGRVAPKIIKKQQLVLSGLKGALRKYDSQGLENDKNLMDLVYCMLEWYPQNRISPQEALNHPFLI